MSILLRDLQTLLTGRPLATEGTVVLSGNGKLSVRTKYGMKEFQDTQQYRVGDRLVVDTNGKILGKKSPKSRSKIFIV